MTDDLPDMRRGRREVCTEPVRDAFIDLIAQGRTAVDAARLLGVKVQNLYAARSRHPKFKAAWEEAKRAGGEVYLHEAHRRAVEGTAEPVFYQGKKVGEVRKYSDRMLQTLLEGTYPETFGRDTNINLNTAILTVDDLAGARDLGRNPELQGDLVAIAKGFRRHHDQQDAITAKTKPST